ncbi:MAG: hypothetical protein FJ215_10190 [Ignavibacteria bacterium]|nr:hypothetical protein [Ignavibacteria bacterium]
MDALLYGHGSARKVVAVQQQGDQHIRLYLREGGKISTSDVEFFPFLYLSDDSLLSEFKQKYWLKELAGHNFFRYLTAFPRWSEYWDAIRLILESTRKRTGSSPSSYAELGTIYTHPDPAWQYLVQSGNTLFRGLEVGDLACLHVSLAAVAPRGKSPIAAKSSNRIVVIDLSDGKGWSKTLDGRRLGEKELISAFLGIVRERDPDLIIGQRLTSESLPYLLRRCSLHQLECPLGRDGSEPRASAPRFPRSSTELEYPPYDIAGRHVIDLESLVAMYDTLRRHAEKSSPRDLLVSYFGEEKYRSSSDQPSHLRSSWDDDPEMVRNQAILEREVTERLSTVLLPGAILLARIAPFPLGSLVRTSPSQLIESVILRYYLDQRHALPKTSDTSITLPDESELFYTGLFSNVLQIEFPDLHARIIQSLDLSPERDELHVVRTLLDAVLALRQNLTETRTDSAERHFDSEVGGMNTLLAGLYAHLTSSRGILNDAPMSKRIVEATTQLRIEIQQIASLFNTELVLRDGSAHFFSAPDNVIGRDEQLQLLERMLASLPSGVEPIVGGTYPRLLSLKRKNYVTLDLSQRIQIHGPSILPHGIELYLRRFVEQAIANILNENIAGLHNLYQASAQSILQHQWTVRDFERRETLHLSLDEYKMAVEKGDRKPSAAYEALLRAGTYAGVGETVAFYVTGSGTNIRISENVRPSEEWDPNFPDENRDFYLMRLREYAARFEMLFSEASFQKLFTHDSLFEFDPRDIAIVTRRESAARERSDTERGKAVEGDFRIWLDDKE